MKYLKLIYKRLKSVCNKDTIHSLKFLPRVLNKFDRALLIALVLVIATSSITLYYRYWIRTTHEVPSYGGTFNEGIVGEAKDLDKHIARLTSAGLTKMNENGQIVGDLAESWEIKDDGKTYEFKLRNGYFSTDLASQLQAKNIWSGIEIATPADNLLDFKFKQPLSPFLYTSTEPVFPYGPYKITKEEKNKVTLEASSDYWQGKPYISKLVINLYADETLLAKAINHGEIMGVLHDTKPESGLKDMTMHELKLPRELDLFFNLSRDAVKDVNVRKSLKDGKALPKEINVTLVTSENPKNEAIATKIQADWKALNVLVTINKYDNITLQKDIIPTRNYDVLLYGLDYGPDPDPYPFWHSSQIKSDGMNLSNYSNKKADKLLEEARQTFDFAIRDQKYTDFKAILDAEVPYYNMDKTSSFYSVSNKVQGVGVVYGASEADRFLNLNRWFINVKRAKN